MEEVINLCFKGTVNTVNTPLIPQQNLYLCLTAVEIWTWEHTDKLLLTDF